MRTFKAFRLLAGDKEPVRTVAELTVDDLSPGNVVIQIAYSSINYKDALASKGLNAIIRTWPRITGIDFVGTVIDSADCAWFWYGGGSRWGACASCTREC